MVDNDGASVKIKVPATSANMGPGFDCIGIALDIWNETIVSRADAGIVIEGEGSDVLPRDASNLIVECAHVAFAELGVPPIGFSLECRNGIPCARGLGSSSAATVTGIAAAFSLASKDVSHPDIRQRIFAIAAEIEGHPDNVAPATFGGCQIGVNVAGENENSEWVTDRIDVAAELRAVIFVPDFEMWTNSARNILTDELPRRDAVFNIGRAALLTNALRGNRWDLLRYATEDRLHQPQRIVQMFPKFRPIARAAMDGGAHGVFLSGAGPTVLALATERIMTICYEMTEAARKAQVEGQARIVEFSSVGLQLDTCG